MPEQQVNKLLGPKDLQINKGDSLNTVTVPDQTGSTDKPLTNSERLKRKKEAEKSGGRGSAKKWLLSLAGVAGLTIAPQLFPQVRNFESDLFSGESTPTSINDSSIRNTFPNILPIDNFEAIVPEIVSQEAQHQNIDLEKMVGTVGFPLDVNTINNTPTIRFAGSFGGELPAGVTKDTVNGVQDVLQITGLPKGTIIYAPVEGGVFNAGTAGVKQDSSGEYIPAYTLLSFRFEDSTGNHGILSLSILGGKPLIDISPLPIGKHPISSDGTQVALFQPIAVMDSDTLINADAKNYAVPGQVGQVTMQIIFDKPTGGPLPLRLNFLTQNGNKIIAPQEMQK